MTRKNTEGTELLLRRLAGALVSWLTFQQAAKRSIMYDEFFMYTPIFELVSAREWKVIPQFSYKTEEGQWPRFDFIFYRTTGDDRVAALEVSYIGSKKNNWKAAKIKDDEAKLRKLKADHFLKGKYGNIKRYVMIAGKENHLKECCRKYFNRANKLLDRPPQTGEGRICIYRSSIKFKAGDYDEGRYSTCWCVMVLSVSNRRTTT